MIGTRLQLFLLVMSCLSLIGLGFSGLLVSRAQGQKARRELRLASIAAPHLRTQKIEVSAFTRTTPRQQRSIATIAASIFGFDPEKPEQYPTKWWIVLLITFAVAKGIQSLSADVLGGTWSILVWPGSWVMLSRNFFGWAEGRRKKALLMQFPDALAMIVRAVRVGIPVLEAIRAVARETPEPTAPEFANLVSQVSIGVSLEDAVLEMARRAAIPEYRFFATALALQNQTGGTLSETLEGLADVIRKRVALVAKGKAMTSEARASAAILGSLPVVTGGALWAMNPSYIGVLFTDPAGKTLLASAVLSLGIGLFIIRALIRKSAP